MYIRKVRYERQNIVQGTGQVELQLDNVRLRDHHQLRIQRADYNARRRSDLQPGSLRISISPARSSWDELPFSNGRTVRFSIGSPHLTFGIDDLDKLLPPRLPQSSGMLSFFGHRLHIAKRFGRFTWMCNVIAPWNQEVVQREERQPKRFISQFSSRDKVVERKPAEPKPHEQPVHSVCTSKTIQLRIQSAGVGQAEALAKPPQEAVEAQPPAQSVSSLVTRFSHISLDTRLASLRQRSASGVASARVEKPVTEAPARVLSPKPTVVTTEDKAVVASEAQYIPPFYFPFGKATADEQNQVDRQLSRAKRLFDKCDGFLHLSDFPELMKVLALPLYWKSALFRATGAKKKEAVSFEALASLWLTITKRYHDRTSRFFHLLAYHRSQDFLEPCDWEMLILDVVNTHPGLRFLKEAKEFISRYCKTVIARIYFTVNRSWSDRITLGELRNSNLLDIIENLEKEDDINKFTDYFSYEHFYVIYCKFWEIDTDHDLFISKEDLYHHNQSAVSRRIIDRIFSGAVSNSAEIKRGLMSYYEFVWFLIAEEDKRSRTSIEYWFRCMDMDGDGYLSMYELEYFYEEQMQRMEMFGFEFMQFEDVMCQMLDLIKPIDRTKIRLMDLKRCKLVNVFLDTFINIEKHLEHDQHDPFASFRGPDVVEVNDWVRYAAEEYENLVSEEQVHSNSEERNLEEADDETRCTEENSVNASSSYDEGNFLVDESSSPSRQQPQLIDTSTL